MSWLALDIGGANLKAANGRDYVASQRFALWEKPQHLSDALRTMISDAPPADHLIATMTGELADCYRTKSEGVSNILTALSVAADGRHTRVYLNDGRMVTPQVAIREPQAAAASNWHALAKFAGRHVKRGFGLLIDVGSTTTDIIPLIDGEPGVSGVGDTERLTRGQLVYTGVERSPVCAVTDTLPWRDGKCPVAQEVFASTWDAYLLLDKLPEAKTEIETADRRPATKEYARERLARSICADRDSFDAADAVQAAEAIKRAQLAKLGIAVRGVISSLPSPPTAAVICGRGEFLARELIERLPLTIEMHSLGDELGARTSRCATAHALAVLARESDA